ncbi:MAG: tetratricopeptide repeat protein [Oscillospiraceae bacterium]
MNISEAKRLIDDFNKKSVHTEQDNFMYIEALQYLFDKTHDMQYIAELGGYYYEIRRFELALKYYEMAAELGDKSVYSGLGYIWYYGRTGKRDYEQAFRWFSLAAENGDIQAEYKLADMYKNGYGVEKNYEKYKEIIEKLYPQVKSARYLHEPLPEIATRLARIREEQGRTDDAVSLYFQARNFLAQRIKSSPFFGNLNIMMWLIDDLYRLVDFDEENMDLFDLYWLLKSPNRVRFYYDEKPQTVESSEVEGEIAVCFNGKWLRNREEFFEKAEIDGVLLTEIQFDLYGFRVE